MTGNDESYQHENSIRKLQMQLRHFVTVSSGMEVTGLGTLQDAKMSNLSDSTVYGSEQRTGWIKVNVVDDPSYSLHTNASTVANTSGPGV